MSRLESRASARKRVNTPAEMRREEITHSDVLACPRRASRAAGGVPRVRDAAAEELGLTLEFPCLAYGPDLIHDRYFITGVRVPCLGRISVESVCQPVVNYRAVADCVRNSQVFHHSFSAAQQGYRIVICHGCERMRPFPVARYGLLATMTYPAVPVSNFFPHCWRCVAWLTFFNVRFFHHVQVVPAVVMHIF